MIMLVHADDGYMIFGVQNDLIKGCKNTHNAIVNRD